MPDLIINEKNLSIVFYEKKKYTYKFHTINKFQTNSRTIKTGFKNMSKEKQFR